MSNVLHSLAYVDDLEPRRSHDLARIGLVQAGDYLHQRRLAFAVAPGQGRPESLVDRKRNPVEDLRTSEGQGDVFQGKEEVRHGE